MMSEKNKNNHQNHRRRCFYLVVKIDLRIDKIHLDLNGTIESGILNTTSSEQISKFFPKEYQAISTMDPEYSDSQHLLFNILLIKMMIHKVRHDQPICLVLQMCDSFDFNYHPVRQELCVDLCTNDASIQSKL